MNARLERLRFSYKTIGRNSWLSRSIFLLLHLRLIARLPLEHGAIYNGLKRRCFSSEASWANQARRYTIYLHALILKKVRLWISLSRWISVFFLTLLASEQPAREQAEVAIPYVGIRSLRLGNRSKCYCR